MGSETNAVEKFDPSTLMEGVRDRIKATFISMIPDLQWEQMVKKEVDAFFQEVKREEDYNNPTWYSQFQVVVWEEMTKHARKHIKEAIENFKSFQWDGSDVIMSEAVEKMIVKNSGMILRSLIGNMIQDAINKLNIPPYQGT